MNEERKLNIPECLDCRKQRQLAITCLDPLGYSAKCKNHQEEFDSEKPSNPVDKPIR